MDLIIEMQDSLRRTGFPRFAEVQSQQVAIFPAIAPAPWQTKYQFTDRDGKRAVVVTPDTVTYVVTSYPGFEDFSDAFGKILSITGRILEPDLVERIGIRYVDLLQPRNGENVREWLQPSLRGLADLDLGQLRFNLELRGLTSVGEFIFKATLPRSGLIPADLQPFELDVSPADPIVDGTYVILDFDHFSIAPRDFDVPTLTDIGWQLHDFVDLAFRRSVTDQAFSAWGAHD